jgi:hypothetical protein
LLGLMYPFAMSSSSWTLISFNSSWLIQYWALARNATFGITLIAWSTRFFEGNSSSNSLNVTFGNSSKIHLTHFKILTKLVASFGSNLSNTCITHNMP